MGTFLNPQGTNAFIELLKKRKKRVFVDKTNFIGETIDLLNSDGKLIAFNRPRRFGKTIMAQMLAAYYAKGVNNEKFFANLKIANYKDFDEFNEQDTEITFTTYLNKFDVLYIDMNLIDDRYTDYLKGKDKAEALNLADYLAYQVICELKENQTYAEILAKAKINDTNLADALQALNEDRDLGNPTFIFIMDEWDLVYRDYRDDVVSQQAFIKLLKSLFKTTAHLKCFSLVYLTGILPIKNTIRSLLLITLLNITC